MLYIEALHLIELCIKHNILKEKDNCILVFREASLTYPRGWYLSKKEDIVLELMHNIDGQNIIISKLQEQGII